MDENMIERVGNAIGRELVDQELAGADFDEAESNAALARAAIQAMRAPTEAMRNAYPNFPLTGSFATKEDSWRAMIDAALGAETSHTPAKPDPGDTSPEIASIAARLMHHDDPDVRRVAASALGQVS